MKKSAIAFVMIIITIIIVLGCKKKDNKTTPPGTKQQIVAGLDSKTWHVTMYYPPATVDTVHSNQGCAMDDQFIFFADGSFRLIRNRTYVNNDGTCVTTINTPDILNGTWTIIDYSTIEPRDTQDYYITIKFNGNSTSYPFFCQKINFSEHTMELDGIDDPGEAPGNYNDYIFGYYKLAY